MAPSTQLQASLFLSPLSVGSCKEKVSVSISPPASSSAIFLSIVFHCFALKVEMHRARGLLCFWNQEIQGSVPAKQL